MCRLPLNLILAKNDLPKIPPCDKVQIFEFSKKVYHVGTTPSGQTWQGGQGEGGNSGGQRPS